MSSKNYRPLSLLVGTAFFMEQLDSTIIAPAIPSIAASLQVDPLSLSLTMTIYLLGSIVLIPAGGYLADRFGTRTVFQAALLLFTLSSVLCGLAGSVATLTLARALQGAGAALMVPVGRMAIVHAASRAELVMALAWMVTPAMVGPLVGPLLGGLIATHGSWRWIFLVNLPIGLAGCWATLRYFPQIHQPAARRFDWLEWGALAILLSCLVLLLESVRHHRLPTLFFLGLGGALALALWLYRTRVRRQERALLDFSLLGYPSFNASFWGGTLARVGYGALPFLLPLQLQLGLGLSAVQSGAILFAGGAVALFTKTWTARVLLRYGFRSVLVWNGALCALALGLCALFQASWGSVAIAAVVCLGALFRAIQFNALAAIAYADLPRDQVAAATSLNTTFQQLAVLFGIALSSLIVESSARFGVQAQPGAGDFALAIGVLALIVLAALPFCLRLPRSAGRELSGAGERN